ncbi:MAG TPA: hypothetical protein VF659_09265 [Pyrinomonadaceae bacterium]|jgi:DNA-binding IclR family transcriptional regulator
MTVRGTRDESQYALDTGLRLLKVLEALEGTNFEPISIERVQQRTGFSYDFCRRALITLKLAGFAAEQNRKWMPGPKIVRFGTNFNALCLASMERRSSDESELKTASL